MAYTGMILGGERDGQQYTSDDGSGDELKFVAFVTNLGAFGFWVAITPDMDPIEDEADLPAIILQRLSERYTEAYQVRH